MSTVLKSIEEYVDLCTVYTRILAKMIEEDRRVVHIDADLCASLGVQTIAEEYPQNIIDTGVMEANMIGVASAMSVAGKIPFVHSFGTFATRRCADQIFISGCYNRANVKIIGSDPGICAESNGGTHMPFEDIGVMRSFPGMTILDIADEQQLEALMPQIKDSYGMMYIRLPRTNTVNYYLSGNHFIIGKANLLTEGSDVSIIASGIEVWPALQAADALSREGISAAVVDMFTIKPIDRNMIVYCAEKTGAIVTAENHNVIGGLGSAVAEVLVETLPVPLARVGVKDRFGEVGDRQYLAETFELSTKDIVRACKNVLERKS